MLKHHPKGGMCATCKHKRKDCSALKFERMQPISKESNGFIEVRCDNYKREGND